MRSPTLPTFLWILASAACAVPLARGQLTAPAPVLPAPALPSPASTPTPPPVSPHGTLNVTFWNLQWFPGHRPGAGPGAQTRHFQAVLPTLRKLRPDLLGLEEVADETAARKLVASLPGGFHVDACTAFTREPDRQPSRQQVVLCSRLPLLTAGWQSFQSTADGLQPRRGFAYAAYRLPANEVLLAYGLHLKSNVHDEPGGDATNAAMREESLRQVLAHQRLLRTACLRWGSVRLALLGGDMNTSLDDPHFQAETTLRRLLSPDIGYRWTWQNLPLLLRQTLPGGGPFPPACFDHIFYQGDQVRLLTAGVTPTGPNASDHRPVSAQFEW